MSSVEPRTAASPPIRKRLPSLDSLRGIALIAMATYHFAWDLEMFGYLEPGTSTSGWLRIYARAIASSFLFLAGFSLVLAHYPQLNLKNFGRRLGVILAAALVITAATYIAVPDAFIFFGILHAIALGSIIGLLFLKVPPVLTLVVAAAMVALPTFYRSVIFDMPILWFVGLSETLPRSNDYVPILPWAGALLAGVAVARLMAAQNGYAWLARLPDGPAWLQWGGRHSLTVYIIHQPILIAVIYLASFVIPPPSPDLSGNYLKNCQPACEAGGSSVNFCLAYCGCTLGELQQQSLLEPLQSGAILPGDDQRLQSIAEVCSAAASDGS
ncbi:DUF1624 domain-containing protein [Peteryoungia desertarenae]|uniref:DUF1624 domain-containing protein n=1 Tax=Peteryoungia desertarenae TaxID=1813451 RepID=A0ABX6QS89_9HYPH|nr:DUF1624 domain-containing protein [Peteryoungia desertarenae]QLF71418.1 DUF1624 domain-containing protein [Peteryoungia desertarenae]